MERSFAPKKNLDTGTRLGSMILDHFIMTMIAMLFFLPVMLSEFFTVIQDQTSGGFFHGPLFYFSLTGFALYFCKDCINGRSLAKRITKLQVVDNSTGQAASPIKCFIRNLFCAIWPVEVIVTLSNPSRRLGDMVAGTKVVYFDPAAEQPGVDLKKLLSSFLLSFGFIFLLTWVLQKPFSFISKPKYVESSYNEAESKVLEKLYTDSMGQYLSASVKVYDTTENSNLKYISVICNLKENYLETESTGREIKQNTFRLLVSQHPENTFTGRLQYVFKEGASMRSDSYEIGARVNNKK